MDGTPIRARHTRPGEGRAKDKPRGPTSLSSADDAGGVGVGFGVSMEEITAGSPGGYSGFTSSAEGLLCVSEAAQRREGFDIRAILKFYDIIFHQLERTEQSKFY